MITYYGADYGNDTGTADTSTDKQGWAESEVWYAVENTGSEACGPCLWVDAGQGKYPVPYRYIVDEFGRQFGSQYIQQPPACRRPVLHYKADHPYNHQPPRRNRYEALRIRRHRNTKGPRTGKAA